jgi:hypothetical protein
MIACDHIEEIARHGIIVRLKTYRNSIHAYKTNYDKFGNQKDLDRYNELVQKRDIEQKAIIKTFNNVFAFSKVFFLPDSNFVDFKEGKSKGIFINENGIIDHTLLYMGNKPHFFINNGKDPSYVVVDINLNTLTEPFPSENIQLVPGNIFNRITDEVFFDEGLLKRDVKTFNNNFWTFKSNCNNSSNE